VRPVSRFRFDAVRLPDACEPLRREVRAFLADTLAGYPARRRAYTWTGWDENFTRAVAARGWIGMTWPRRWGGSERSALERYVVLEEMLAAGAPVAAHWIGDRQSGPLLLRYGTDAQRAAILPRVCRGEAYFCIGMSEPDSGSDLASIRTRAERTADGWRVTGTKLWTTGAHHCEYMIALVRTGAGAQRHAGLSQFLIPLHAPGVAIRPIRDLAGNEHFCEVVFDEARVPADALVGAEGNGWAQVMAELAYERSGPERYLSCHPLFTELVRTCAAAPDPRARTAIGRELAQVLTLRNLSIAVAHLLEAGHDPALEAAVVKDVGAVFEQDLPGVAQSLVACEPSTDGSGTPFTQALGELVQNAPSFSLRGGTREILRGIIARGLGLR
jgi:alkylation response protein AidB-like acyl-CoA dehydrogenase